MKINKINGNQSKDILKKEQKNKPLNINKPHQNTSYC